MRRLAAAALLSLCVLGVVASSSAASPHVVLAFLPATERLTACPAGAGRVEPLPLPIIDSLRPCRPRAADAPRHPVQASVLDRLDRRKDLAIGLLGATQGGYSLEQALLDITQGTRTSKAAYKPSETPELGFVLTGRGSAFILDWGMAVRRAKKAPQTIVPGLLAGSIPGGAGYAGVVAHAQKAAIVAAGLHGHVAGASIGSANTVAERALKLLRHHAFVVAALPQGRSGGRELDQLRRARGPDDLLIVIKDPPDRLSPQLLPIGIAGLSKHSGALTSATTRRIGIVAGIDVLPTVLQHLGLKIPSQVKGEPMRVGGVRSAATLRDTETRLSVLSSRRTPALKTAFTAWLALLIALWAGRGAVGLRAGLRIGGLGMLWFPSALLVTAAIEPERHMELTLITILTLGLATITAVLVPWPRGPIVPAVVGLLFYTVDLVRNSNLIVHSLFGPNPRFGSRYYGLGNELESVLPILLYAGVAAWLSRPGGGAVPPSRRAAWTFGLTGLLLGAVMGSGRLGADVGGVITVGAGTAVAVLLVMPGGITKRRVIVAALVPVLAIGALAALDLSTGGNSHFTRTVLHAGSVNDLLNIGKRRLELAGRQLTRGSMVWLTPLCAVGALVAFLRRKTLYAPVSDEAPWRAAFGGGLAGSIAGALGNDSGPLLLVFGVVTLGLVTAYIRGDPRLAASSTFARDPADASHRKRPEHGGNPAGALQAR